MTSPLLLCSLLPDVLRAIVKLGCSDLHSTDADAAASAQDTATALRLTCRTLKAAVDATVAQLDIRASSSADLTQAAALFPGLQQALGRTYTDIQSTVASTWHLYLCLCGLLCPTPACRSSKDEFAGSSRRNHNQGHA